MSSTSIQDLYDAYEVISNKTETKENKVASYKKILTAADGDEKEKRLSSQFIVTFFELFPELHELAFNKLLDLCEEENIAIRKQVIQLLPTVAKKVGDYLPKAADTLTQMLITDDSTEIAIIYSSLNTVLNINLKIGLEAIFNQLLTQLEEANELMNTYAFKYLSDKFSTMTEIKPEIETVIETNCAKLMDKLSGHEEFYLVISMMASLKNNATVIGRQKLITQLTEKTKLFSPINEVKKFNTVILTCRQAAKLLSKNVHADDLLVFLLENLSQISKLDLKDCEYKLKDLLQCMVGFANRGKNAETNTQVSKLDFSGEESLKQLKELYELFLNKLPEVPEEVTEEKINKLSEEVDLLIEIETILLAVYYLCKIRPEIITQDDKFKARLQYLGRVNQVAHKSANEAINKLTKMQKKMEENKNVLLLSRVTGNLQVLIREMFKTPPSFKLVIIPSWDTTAVSDNPVENNAGKKRPAGDSKNNNSNKFPYRQGGRFRNFNQRNFRRRP